MPNRILKESLLRSRKIAMLTAEEERLFIHLLLSVDDYGCFYADPALVKAACLPNIADTIPTATARAWLDRLDEVGLILRYVVDGEVYLFVPKATEINKPRAKERKFAPPEKGQRFSVLADASICEHPQASASIREHMRAYSITSTSTDSRTDTGADAPESMSPDDDPADDAAQSAAPQTDLLGQPLTDPTEEKITEVLKAWAKVTAQKRPIITGKGSEAKRSIIRARLSENGGDADELIRALGGWLKDDYYVSGGYSQVDNIYRSRDRVEKFLAREAAPARPNAMIASTGTGGASNAISGGGSVREWREYDRPPPEPGPDWTPEAALAKLIHRPAFMAHEPPGRFVVPKGKSLGDFDTSRIPPQHLPILDLNVEGS